MLSVSSVFQAEHLDSAAAAPSDCQNGGLLCLLHARYVPALLARASGYCTGFVEHFCPFLRLMEASPLLDAELRPWKRLAWLLICYSKGVLSEIS